MLGLLGNRITNLARQSESVISVFTDTIKKLTEINEEATSEITNKKFAIKELNEDVEVLTKLTEDNNRVISKVKQIIE